MQEKYKKLIWNSAGILLEIGALYLIINSAGFPDGVKKEVKIAQDYKCRWCGQKLTLEAHHRIAQRDGGSNSPYNAVGLCDPCHEYWDSKSEEGELFPLELMPIRN